MTLLPIHILAGVLALVFGYVALFAAKGATLHRKSGLLFVFAMVTLSLTGALVAFLTGSSVSVIAGLLTFYFVTTALLTVRRRSQDSHWIDAGAMLFALTIAILGFKTGRQGHRPPHLFNFGLYLAERYSVVTDAQVRPRTAPRAERARDRAINCTRSR